MNFTFWDLGTGS